jgi:hypothetical protein
MPGRTGGSVKADPDAAKYWGSSAGPRTKSSFFEGEHLMKTMTESAFGRFMRLIEKVAEDLDLDTGAFRLPRVVVVGAESAGKSSLLESITKASIFPRDSNICTKMPVRLCLAPQENGREQETLEYQGQVWELKKEDLLDRVKEIMGCGGVCMEWFQAFQDENFWLDHCRKELPAAAPMFSQMPITSYRSVPARPQDPQSAPVGER